jgi:hypothetical protein
VALSGDYELSVLTAEGEVGEETDEKNESIVSAEGKSIREAVEKCDKATAGELFFGHTTVCIVNTELLENGSAVREAAEYMKNETQISRRVILFASDNPERVLKGESESGGRDVADFVKEYYKTHDKESPVELDKLCRALAENGDLVLPVISYDSGFELDGAVLMSDGVLAKKLNDTEYKKVSWLLKENTCNIVTVENAEESLSVEIKDKSVRVNPEEIEIRIKLKEGDGGSEYLTDAELKQIENKIKKEATEGLEILQKYNCDAVDMRHALEKARVDKTTDVLEGVNINVDLSN